MASNTQKLELYKVNPQTDGDMTFNIETMLNQNWDKVDNFAQEVESKLNEVDDVEEAVLMIIEKIGSLNQLDTDTKNDLVAAVNEVHQKFVAHTAQDMPHKFTGSNGKIYRWGFGQQNGVYGFIYKEVID